MRRRVALAVSLLEVRVELCIRVRRQDVGVEVLVHPEGDLLLVVALVLRVQLQQNVVLSDGFREHSEGVEAYSLHQLAVAVGTVHLDSLLEIRQRQPNFSASVEEEASQVVPVRIRRIHLDRLREESLGARPVPPIPVRLRHICPRFLEVRVELCRAFVRNYALPRVSKSVFAEADEVPRDRVPGFHVQGFPEVLEALAVVMHLVVHDSALVEALVVGGYLCGLRQILDSVRIEPERGARLPAALPPVGTLGVDLGHGREVLRSLREVPLESLGGATSEVRRDELRIPLEQAVEEIQAQLVVARVHLEVSEGDLLVGRRVPNAVGYQVLSRGQRCDLCRVVLVDPPR
mmetsp:Transcript_62421/g.143003  ORF Transcript_62421/g.143003 Transcript_62421/m.143003 type:complete len:347 (+) Transcript_62421:1233-2273(+)